MLISAILPWTTERMQRNKNAFSSIEWVTNATLQLQRLAHEAIGVGDWEGACDDYPRTRESSVLAVLDITDRKHPVLRLPQAADIRNEKEKHRMAKRIQ
ncbi:predicted protein [Plenodomus lingam JN3]|uniref:Predicted protein n=1 Tax=Leptosphaeria maculans (strain JN3 / isolate v23.1.3 / race Av1-4-5-6-7-8) TaxID=985895 RepID=E5AAY8_LEPMJ|nr:predicted protein [Plenodomus lingam JN3]CBY00829.1 predicted protein [Plenodomus lingam JN3]